MHLIYGLGGPDMLFVTALLYKDTQIPAGLCQTYQESWLKPQHQKTHYGQSPACSEYMALSRPNIYQMSFLNKHLSGLFRELQCYIR